MNSQPLRLLCRACCSKRRPICPPALQSSSPGRPSGAQPRRGTFQPQLRKRCCYSFLGKGGRRSSLQLRMRSEHPSTAHPTQIGKPERPLDANTSTSLCQLPTRCNAHVGGRQDQRQPMSAVDTPQSNAHEGGRQDQHQPVPLADAQQSNAHDGGRQDQHQPMPADDTQQSNAHEGGRQDPHQPVPLADAQQCNAHDGVAAAVPPPDGHPRRTDAVHSGVHRRDCGVATCPPGDPVPNQPEAPLHEPEAVLRDDSPTAPPLTHDALDTTEGPADGPGEPHGAHTRRFNPLQGARLRAAFAAIEPYDVETVLSHPCSMLRAPPHFLKGPLRKALRFALDLIYHAGSPEGLGQEQAWKIWLLLPRMLLFRHPGSSVPKREFLARFDDFFHGRWQALVRASGAFPQGQPSAAEAPDPCHRETGQPGDDAARRADRAVRLARLGELSAARQALMADPLAPGDADTLQRLTDPTSRPNQQYEPIPQGLSDWAPDRAVELLPECFLANLRRRRGAAGPSGLTGEMLRLVLDDEEASDLLWRVGARLARVEIPAVVVPWIGLGRMVAVRKPSGGVRGLVVGDVLRRLVSRTLAQQCAERFDVACQPYQYALSTRCGSEALVHTLQYLTQTSPAVTVLSVDGVGAYDHVSRLAMLQALRDTPDACRVLPYVRLWYSTPSAYVWIDGNNCPHRVTQAEGGEQGDPLMPALFSLGMHRALTALQTELQPGERVFAFLDDLYIVAAPERVRTLFDAVARRLYEEVRISLNHAKTRVWNAAAVEPPGLDTLAPDGTAWCGAEASPAEERGITVLGAPLGTDAYVQTQLTAVSDRQLRFLQVLPTLPDLQVAWLLLLYCASPRSNYALRMLPPNLTAGFASASDQAVQQCLYSLLNADNSGHLPQQAAWTRWLGTAECPAARPSCFLGVVGRRVAGGPQARSRARGNPFAAACSARCLCFPGRGPSRGCALGPMRL